MTTLRNEPTSSPKTPQSAVTKAVTGVTIPAASTDRRYGQAPMASSRSGTRLVAVATAFLVPVVFSTSLSSQVWSPRVALLLVLAAFGLPHLFPLLRSDARRPALAALAFLVVAAIATALSPQPILSLFGLYEWGTEIGRAHV